LLAHIPCPFQRSVMNCHDIGEYSERQTEGQLPVSLLIATGLSC